VTVEDTRDILGLWVGAGGEGATCRQDMRTEVTNRGVAEGCMLVGDGLTGLPDAVANGGSVQLTV
jgi:transposase-like protein